MARSFLPQFTFSSGQFDPDLYQRGDLKSYYAGAKTIRNCFCKLTGGVERRYGTEYVDSTPAKCTLETLSDGGFTLTNLDDGTAANLIDGNRETTIVTNNVASTDYEIFKYDFGSEKTIQYVDVYDVYVSGYTGDAVDGWKLQISTNGTDWTDISAGAGNYYQSGSRQDLSYLVGTSGRYVRLLSGNSFASNPVSVSQVKIYSYSAENDNVRLKQVQVNAEGEAEFFPILVVFGSYHAHLYYTQGDTTIFLNSIHTGLVETLNRTMSITIGDRASIIITDNTISPVEIKFLYCYDSYNAPISFRDTTISLLNIPTYEFDPSDTSPATTLTPSAVTGYITLTAGASVFLSTDVGKKIDIQPIGRLRIIQYDSDTVVKANVEQKLSGTDAIASGSWTIERGWEPIISSTRGWPLCSAYYNGRLYFGGTRSLPALLMASTIEDNFDFDLADQSDSDGFWRALKTRHPAIVTSLQSHNTLEIYTSEGVYILSSGNITPANVNVKRATPVGIKQFTDPEEIQSTGSVYLDSNNDAIYRLVYTDDLQSYQSNLISQHAGSLIQIKSDPYYAFGLWTGDINFRADQLFFINPDDEIITATLFLDENVSAFSVLDIKYRNPSTDAMTKCSLISLEPCDNGIAIVAKSSGADDKYCIVFMRDDRYLDFSQKPTPSGTTITVGSKWDGEKLDVVADGDHLGTFTVASGAIDLGGTYTDVEVGWPFYSEIETLPIENLEQIGSSIGKDKSISQVYINPKSIANLYINDSLVFDETNANAKTESFVYRAVFGWSREQTLKISQQKPLEFSIKNILMTIEVNS
jgi:hypothetical protein